MGRGGSGPADESVSGGIDDDIGIVDARDDAHWGTEAGTLKGTDFIHLLNRLWARMPKRKVKQGECFFSIAADANLPWETLWNHAENAGLKSKRKLPNVLYPGDELFVPESEKKTESSPSENKHKFKVKRPKTCIRLNLLYDGKPMGNIDYKLEVDGKLHEGKTDDKGVLKQAVEATAKEGLLEIKGHKSVHKLQLGYLDPVGNTSGLQARLNNLGFDAGKVDDKWGKLTRTGMRGFQSNKKMKTSKTPNDDTRNRLEQEYGG